MKKAKSLLILAASALILAGCNETSSSSKDSVSSKESSATSSVSSVPSSESSSSTSSASSSKSTSSEDPTPVVMTGTNVFTLLDEPLAAGGQDVAKVGQLTVYAGDGGEVIAKTYEENALNVTFKNNWGTSAHWWDVQTFYKAPYLNQGSKIGYRLKVKSTSAGKITINGKVYTLAANTELQIEEASYTMSAASALVICFGADGSGLLPDGTLTLKDFEVYDVDGTYYDVVYKNGDTTLKSIKALSGAKAWFVPEITTPAGKVFAGWYDGETKFDPNTENVAKAMTLTAKFLDESEVTSYNVNYYIGEKLIETAKVIENQKAVSKDYGYDKCGFGYNVMGWYSDADLTTAYDFDTAVTSAVNLYAKLNVKESGTYNYDYELPGVTNDNDGDLVYTESIAQAGDAAWRKQINFAPVTAGESGKTYTLSFAYKMNVAGGHVQIYDSTTRAQADLPIAAEWTTVKLNYEGGVLDETAKLTFEMGLVSGDVKFELKDITIAEKAAEPIPTPTENKTFPFIDNAASISGAGVFVWVKPSDFGEGLTAANYAETLSKAVKNGALTASVSGTSNFSVSEIVPQRWGENGDDSLCLYITMSDAPADGLSWGLDFSYVNTVAKFTGSLKFKGSALAKPIEIAGEKLVNVGETLSLTATADGEASDVTWTSSDASIATVFGDNLSATVTGVAAGSATITVSATVGGKTVTDTYEITVRTPSTETKEFPFIADKCRMDGAGIFVWIKPSMFEESIDVTNYTTFFKNAYSNKTLKIEVAGVDISVNELVPQQWEGQGTDSLCLYMIMSDTVAADASWSLSLSYTNSVATFAGSLKFKGTSVVQPLEISGDKSVKVGDTLSLTATADGEASDVTWTSSDKSIATVVGDNLSATVTGVAAGSATITVSATVGGKAVSATYAITVKAEASSTSALPIVSNNGQTRIAGAQAWIYVDNSTLAIPTSMVGYSDFEATIKGTSHDEASAPFDSETGTNPLVLSGKKIETINESFAVFYVNWNIGVNETWDFTTEITITFDYNGTQYVGTATFNGLTYAA